MNVSDALKENNFVMKKRFGQNFITDLNLLKAIADDAQITKDDTVLEVGAGAGTLTAVLAQRAKRVVSFEIDRDLAPVLSETLGGYDNVSVVYKDILKVSPDEINGLIGGTFKVVANLPYYITSPVLFYFLENDFELASITVMVQREVADRMVATCGTPQYGALSLAIAGRSDAVITRTVSRKMFFPVPSVDSAVVRLDIKELKNLGTFDRLVKCAFSMRRKTLVNNLMQGMWLTRQKAEELVVKAGLDIKVRGEALDLSKFVKLAEIIDNEP